MKDTKAINKQFGGTYREENEYRIPNLALPVGTSYPIGKYGRMHLDYLKKHRQGRYTSLLTQGKLNGYIHTIDEQVHEQIASHIVQMAQQMGVSEDMKASDPLRWVQMMNHIKASAEEIVLREVIFR